MQFRFTREQDQLLEPYDSSFPIGFLLGKMKSDTRSIASSPKSYNKHPGQLSASNFLQLDMKDYLGRPTKCMIDQMSSSRCTADPSGSSMHRLQWRSRRKPPGRHGLSLILLCGLLLVTAAAGSFTPDDLLKTKQYASHTLVRRSVTHPGDDNQAVEAISESPIYDQLPSLAIPNAASLPVDRRLSDIRISRSYATDLYKKFCPMYEFGSSTDCRKVNSSNATAFAITQCKTVHTLSQPRIVRTTSEKTVFQYRASRNGRAYTVNISCLNEPNDKS